MRRIVLAAAAAAMSASLAAANHHPAESDYPGSWAIADGHGNVAVKVQHIAAESCWRIKNVREGVPDIDADQPTDRYLYVTLNIEKSGEPCRVASTPLEAKITIADKQGKISLDIFIVDERGVLRRSQRHRIERDCGASTSSEC